MSKSERAAKPVVYLVCFAQTPYHHARHYLGMTTLPVQDRLKAHRGTRKPDGSSYGRPARLLSRLLQAGGDFILADTWECASFEEARTFERRLKRQGGGARACSICRPGNGRGGGRGRNRYGVQQAKVAG